MTVEDIDNYRIRIIRGNRVYHSYTFMPESNRSEVDKNKTMKKVRRIRDIYRRRMSIDREISKMDLTIKIGGK